MTLSLRVTTYLIVHYECQLIAVQLNDPRSNLHSSTRQQLGPCGAQSGQSFAKWPFGPLCLSQAAPVSHETPTYLLLYFGHSASPLQPREGKRFRVITSQTNYVLTQSCKVCIFVDISINITRLKTNSASLSSRCEQTKRQFV